VEQNPDIYRNLKENCELLDSESTINVVRQSAEDFIRRTKEKKFDFIFFDPPYKSNCYDWLDLALEKLLKPDGIIYIESATKIELESLCMIREKKTKTLFYGIYKYDR
ncbi:MAG: RsmD family RNA methyltransferase, partial [Methylophilaceae bacterium]